MPYIRLLLVLNLFAIVFALTSTGAIAVSASTVTIDPANIQPLHEKPTGAEWFDGQMPRPAVEILLKTLEAAPSEGLIASDYNVHALRAQLAATPLDTTTLRQELTKAAISYINDVAYGRYRRPPVDPKLQDLYHAPEVPAEALLNEALKRADFGAALADLPPPHALYRTLRAEYQRLAESETEDFPQIPSGSALLPSTEDSRTALIAKRMIAERLLSASSAFAAPQNTFYGGELVEAVQAFQRDHGLKPDGILGEATRYAMNITPKQRRRQLLVNMERLRWLPRDLGPRYVMVNIPSATLKAVENNSEKLHMRVIVGRPTRPTPTFSSTISGVVFKPMWHVPKTIAVQDKLPLIRQNPGWLDKHNFEVLQNGVKVSPWRVPWRSYNENYFPVLLRQKAGKGNALGNIRFNLQNSMAIYLHDTSEPGLFSSEERARSSGCVRVSQPLQLAHFVFEGSPEWTPAKLDETYNTAIKTKHASLFQETAAHLVYLTVYPNMTGQLVYYPDVYSLDAPLLQEMVATERSF